MGHSARLATTLLVVAGLAAPAGAAPTSPDPGFGGDGSVILHSDAHSTYLGDMEVLDDGRVMLLVLTGADPVGRAVDGLQRRRRRGAAPPRRQDRLFGGSGKDRIYGQGGNDLLVGSAGKGVLRDGAD